MPTPAGLVRFLRPPDIIRAILDQVAKSLNESGSFPESVTLTAPPLQWPGYYDDVYLKGCRVGLGVFHFGGESVLRRALSKAY